MTPETDQDFPGIPSHEEIEILLKHFQPLPSPRFYLRMQKAPWHSQPTALLRRRVWLVPLALVTILVLGIFLSPPLRIMARQLVLYFWPDQRDQMDLSFDLLDTQQLYLYATPEYFPYSIEELSQIVGFQVSQLAELLPGMQLIGGRYEPGMQTTVLLYQGSGYNLFLSQRSLISGQEFFSIGASAVVESVSIGDNQGEYVAGGWVDRSEAPSSEPETSPELRANWDETLPQYTLRWQVQDYAFQLRSTGITGPQKDELIILAQSIQ